MAYKLRSFHHPNLDTLPFSCVMCPGAIFFYLGAAQVQLKHLHNIDDGLPAKRTWRLCGPLSRHQTYLFTQLRKGYTWLGTYAKFRKFSEGDRRVCGAKETVVHVLVDCRELQVLRRQLRERVGENKIKTQQGN